MAVRRAHLFRLSVLALVALSFAFTGLLVWLFVATMAATPAPIGGTASAILLFTLINGSSALTTLVAGVLALILAFRLSDRQDARSLALFLAFLPLVWDPIVGWLAVTWAEAEVLPPVEVNRWIEHAFVITPVATWLTLAAFVRFSALFPQRLGADDVAEEPDEGERPWWRRDIGLGRWTLRAFLRPWVVWGMAALLISPIVLPMLLDMLHLQLGFGLPDSVEAVVVGCIVGAEVLGFSGGLLLGLSYLRTGYRLAGDEERRRVLWIVAGFGIGGGMLLMGLLGSLLAADSVQFLMTVFTVVLPLAPLVVTVFSAIAVFYKGALDPALVIRKTTLYGALGAIAVFGFAALEEIASNQLVDRFGLPGDVGTVLTAGFLGLVLLPVERRLRRMTNNMIDGDGDRSVGSAA